MMTKSQYLRRVLLGAARETPHRFRVEARLRGADADLVWRMVPLTGYDPLWLATRWGSA